MLRQTIQVILTNFHISIMWIVINEPQQCISNLLSSNWYIFKIVALPFFCTSWERKCQFLYILWQINAMAWVSPLSTRLYIHCHYRKCMCIKHFILLGEMLPLTRNFGRNHVVFLWKFLWFLILHTSQILVLLWSVSWNRSDNCTPRFVNIWLGDMNYTVISISDCLDNYIVTLCAWVWHLLNIVCLIIVRNASHVKFWMII